METDDFLTRSRVLIVVGKGGVGKTVVAGALARAGARSGLRVAVLEVDRKAGLAASFGLEGPLTYSERVLVAGGPGEGDVIGRSITPDEALLEYLEDHGMRRVSVRLLKTGAVEVAATAAPGIKDLLILGKVKQLAARSDLDLVILDAPAAGHAVSVLRSPQGLADSVSGGPVASQAAEVIEMLSDPARCQVMLVTLAEETPMNETIETAFDLEEEIGVHLGPVVVNGLARPAIGLDADPSSAASELGRLLEPDLSAALSAAGRHTAELRRRQEAQLDRLERLLPLPQLRLPRLLGTEMTPASMDTLADHLDESLAGLPAELLA